MALKKLLFSTRDYVKKCALIKAEIWRQYVSTYSGGEAQDDALGLEYDTTKITR